MFDLCLQIHTYSSIIHECTKYTKQHNYLFITYSILDLKQTYTKILKLFRRSWFNLNMTQRDHILFLIDDQILRNLKKLRYYIYIYHKKSTDIYDLLEEIILSFQSISADTNDMIYNQDRN